MSGFLKATDLAARLAELPEGACVSCNAVGNLRVTAGPDLNDPYIGFIDFLPEQGEVELFETLQRPAPPQP
jgi:hypothetical protein